MDEDDPTADDLTGTAFFGWPARLVSRLAAATGRTEQAAVHGEPADRIAAAFAARFVAADGTVSDRLCRSVGGLGPASPGYRTILVAPKPGGTLTSARTSLDTSYGPASSARRRSGDRLMLSITIPTGTSATVRVPAAATAAVAAPPEAVPQGYSDGTAVFTVPSGTYAFTVN